MTFGTFDQSYFDAAARALSAVAGRPLSGAEIGRLETMVRPAGEPVAVHVVNPVKGVRARTNAHKLLDFLEQRKPIMTGHGTLFETHDVHQSVVGFLVKHLMDARKVVKKRMLKLLDEGRSHDDAEVKALNQEQKIYKLLANSFYGAFAEKGFHFYNGAMGPAVTYTGQLIIAATLWTFEALMGGNYWLRDEAELMRHVAVCLEAVEGEDPTALWGEAPAPTQDEAAETLRRACATDWECGPAVARAVARLGTRTWAVALRGNMDRFFAFPAAMEKLNEVLGAGPDMNSPDRLSKAQKATVDQLVAGIIRWVAPPYFPGDMPRRVADMEREVVLLTDTDSTFLTLASWMRFIGRNFDVADASRDDRLMIINVIIYILARFNDSAMERLTANMNVPAERRGMINFKSEFIMRRVILTEGKKNYIGLVEFQEGAALTDKKTKQPGVMEIKGLQIKKVGTPKSTGDYFKGIIESRLMRPAVPDRRGMVKDVVDFEAKVRASMALGETKYAKPETIGRMAEYEKPYQLPPIRGQIAWNCLYHSDPIKEGDPALMFRIRVGTDLAGLVSGVGLDPTRPLRDQVGFAEGQDPYRVEVKPGLTLGGLEALIHEFFTDGPEKLRSNGFNWIAFPKTLESTPEWIRPLIDAEEVVLNNLAPISPVLTAIGIRVHRLTAGDVYSNTVEF